MFNKDFDLLIVTNKNHAIYGVREYIERRRWDFLVKHILGVNPPKGTRLRDLWNKQCSIGCSDAMGVGTPVFDCLFDLVVG